MKPFHPNRILVEHEGHQHRVKRGWLGTLHWENFDFLNPMVEGIVKLSGLFRRGYRNATDIRTVHVPLHLSGLPDPFDGYRILWISDIHVERFGHLPDVIKTLADPLEYDLCIFGGDTCFEHYVSEKAITLTERIISNLVKKSPVLGILGNHDFIPIAELLDSLGVRMLLNEHTLIERGGETLWFAGVDDCHYFHADDLAAAAAGIAEGACRILLSHSPELYKEAAKAGFDACLSGHTHGGQICLPGGVSVISSASVPRSVQRGLWNEGKMVGYTCSGAAASGAAVRFNCRPEITLLTLRKKNTDAGMCQ